LNPEDSYAKFIFEIYGKEGHKKCRINEINFRRALSVVGCGDISLEKEYICALFNAIDS
jgi:hypothetical protein